MSDPTYMHEFDPSRKGLCKRIAGGKHCQKPENAIVHQRFVEQKQREEEEVCPLCGR